MRQLPDDDLVIFSTIDEDRAHYPALHGKSLALYFPFLRGGGAERLYLNLAPFFIAAGLEVTFLLDRREGELLDALPPGAKLEVLEAPRLRHAITRLSQYIRTNSPDLLFSSLSLNNIAVIWADALARGRTRVIVSQHNALSREVAYGGIFRALPMFNRLFLRRADAIVAVSQGVADDLRRIAHLPSDRIQIVPNGAITPAFSQAANLPSSHPWLENKEMPVILGVGRLTPQKDFPTLLRSFAALCENQAARLIILGEGEQRAQLQELAQSLGVAQAVDMPGYRANPLPFMREADLFVLSSSHEGFGLVLAEALACGTPVISTDCPFGPSEILQNGRYGDLVPVGDWQRMAEAMRRALETPCDENALRARGQEFSVAGCAEKYLALFDRVLSETAA